MKAATFGEAAAPLRAGGYAPCAVPFGADGPPGAWMVIPLEYGAQQYAADGVGVFGWKPATQAFGTGEPVRDIGVLGLHVDIPDRKLRGDVEALITRYVPAGSPKRIACDGSALWPLRFDDGRFGGLHLQARSFGIPGLPDYPATITQAPIVVSGLDRFGKLYAWEHSSPLTVPRDELPAISGDAASLLIGEINTLLAGRLELPASVLPGWKPPPEPAPRKGGLLGRLRGA